MRSGLPIKGRRSRTGIELEAELGRVRVCLYALRRATLLTRSRERLSEWIVE
jgi:hypothetical protein